MDALHLNQHTLAQHFVFTVGNKWRLWSVGMPPVHNIACNASQRKRVKSTLLLYVSEGHELVWPEWHHWWITVIWSQDELHDHKKNCKMTWILVGPYAATVIFQPCPMIGRSVHAYSVGIILCQLIKLYTAIKLHWK